MHKWQTFHKWQIFSLCNTRYCVVHVIIITFWIITIQVLICHIYAYINICTHTRTHTHTHTHTQMGQIERNKLKYLHYLNKMTEKCKIKKFIFSEVSCFQPKLFQMFCLDFKWLHSSFGIQWTPLTDTSHSKAAIRNLGKILKN